VASLAVLRTTDFLLGYNNMKKKNFGVIFIIVIILTLLFACSIDTSKKSQGNDTNNASHIIKQSDGTTKYIFSKKACGLMFNITPREAIDSFPKSPWAISNYRGVSVDNYGNLVIVLSDEDIEEWKKYHLEELSEAVKRGGRLGVAIEIDVEYKKLVYSSTRADAENLLGEIIWYQTCAILQVLMIDEDPEKVKVEVIAINIDTGSVIWDFTMPDDTLTLSIDDWDV
jgi:hypothetical protein